MEITLVKKATSADSDPLIIFLDVDESLPVEKRRKETVKIALGETIDLPDDIAYQIMGKYKGFFQIKVPDMKAEEPKYKTKIVKPEL